MATTALFLPQHPPSHHHLPRRHQQQPCKQHPKQQSASANSPTTAMLRRIRMQQCDSSDTSTFDTKQRHGQHGHSGYYKATPTQSLEVSTSPRRGKKEATIVLTPPPRPLSPLTMTSTFELCNDHDNDAAEVLVQPEERQPTSTGTTHTHSANRKAKKHRPVMLHMDSALSVIPKPIPEPPIDTETDTNRLNRSCLSTLPSFTKEKKKTGIEKPLFSTTPKQPANSTSTSTSLWTEFWQRCFGDCYCLSGSTNARKRVAEATTTTTQEEPSEYFQFLPQCAEEDDLNHVMPKLCQQVQSGSARQKTRALQHLAHLCDSSRTHNRIPMVCSTLNDWDVIGTLCHSVLVKDTETTLWKDYRQALLVLSNLTLPMENKAVLMLGPHRDALLQALYDGLAVATAHNKYSTTKQQQLQLEVHLVCAILFNLSFLQDGKSLLTNYIRTPPTLPTHNKQQQSPFLIKILEALLLKFQPFVAPTNVVTPTVAAPIASSVERQAMRWTFGLMRNLCQSHHSDSDNSTRSYSSTTTAATTQSDKAATITNARIIGQTRIPQMALECVGYSATLASQQQHESINMGQWTAQSLEDLALGFLVELALREQELDDANTGKRTVLAPALHQLSCRKHLDPLLKMGGIHGMRANAIVKRFDGDVVVNVTNSHNQNNTSGKQRKTPQPSIASV